jgi:hypothetical protein
MVDRKDIVARLWEAYADMKTGTREDLKDAADEIERLRAEIKSMKQQADYEWELDHGGME